jgi:uncharacterized integral membrane protein (TIGR00698 family)
VATGAGRVLIPLGVAACLFPFVSPAIGLLLGLALALTVGNPYLARTRGATQKLLSIALVGLGAGMDLRVVVRAGIHGILYSLVGIVAALALAAILTRSLRIGHKTGVLIGVGTAICGGSAIAAIVPVIKPKEHETSIALGIVFVLNAVALFIFPIIGHQAGLSDTGFGLWSALAIHDTSSVVGAAVIWGGKAVELATTVKLARALWIVPLTLVIAAWYRRTQAEAGHGRVRWPWFIGGFLVAAALFTYLPGLESTGRLVSTIAKRILVVTLFLIGSNLTRGALRRVGPRPLAMGILLWVAVASLSLGAIILNIIR